MPKNMPKSHGQPYLTRSRAEKHVTPVTRSRARTVGPVRGHRSAAGQLLSLPLGRPAARTQSPL